MPKPSSKTVTVDGFDPRSPGDKKFIKKHVVQKHEDPNGNGDEVFKASNVKFGGRFPHHGYEPGQDKTVYEAAIKGIIKKVVANNTKEQPKPDDVFNKTPDGKKFPAKTKETFVNEDLTTVKNTLSGRRAKVLSRIKNHINDLENKKTDAVEKAHTDAVNDARDKHHIQDDNHDIQLRNFMKHVNYKGMKFHKLDNKQKNWKDRLEHPSKMKNFMRKESVNEEIVEAVLKRVKNFMTGKLHRTADHMEDHIRKAARRQKADAMMTKHYLSKATSAHNNFDQKGFSDNIKAATDSSERETTNKAIEHNWKKRINNPQKLKNFMKKPARSLHEILKRTKGNE